VQESPNLQPAEEANRNIYAEPPPLSQTLFGNKDKDKAKKDEPSTFFNQAALTVGSLLLIVVFVVVSGGSDLANIASPRQSAPQVRSMLKLGHSLLILVAHSAYDQSCTLHLCLRTPLCISACAMATNSS